MYIRTCDLLQYMHMYLIAGNFATHAKNAKKEPQKFIHANFQSLTNVHMCVYVASHLDDGTVSQF